MLTTAKILAHSIDQHGQHLITLELYYPRKIHSEVMTYRLFSRNTASSRAIPFERNLEDIEENLYIPEDIRHNQKGMQGFEKFSEQETFNFQNSHVALWEKIKQHTEVMWASYRPHKQHINRYMESFQYIRVILTSGLPGINNLLDQRLHQMADPEFFLLAEKIQDAVNNSVAVKLNPGQLHLPFIKEDEKVHSTELLIKIAIARSARVSYNNHETKTLDYKKDLELYTFLRAEKHMSPFEHVAICTGKLAERYYDYSGDWTTKNVFYNFDGWKSIRFMIEQENYPL